MRVNIRLGASIFDWDIRLGFMYVPEIEEVEDPKMFQNLKVSSADADTIMSPSGDLAKCSTRDVCPRNSLSFDMLL